jgi:hypothetical protein
MQMEVDERWNMRRIIRGVGQASTSEILALFIEWISLRI